MREREWKLVKIEGGREKGERIGKCWEERKRGGESV